MSNYLYPIEDDTALKIKQQKCKHKFEDCDCPSFKCLLCGKYQDNLFNEYRAKIEVLECLLAIDEDLLRRNGVGYISVRELILGGIIDLWLKEKRRKYGSRHYTEEPFELVE